MPRAKKTKDGSPKISLDPFDGASTSGVQVRRKRKSDAEPETATNTKVRKTASKKPKTDLAFQSPNSAESDSNVGKKSKVESSGASSSGVQVRRKRKREAESETSTNTKGRKAASKKPKTDLAHQSPNSAKSDSNVRKKSKVKRFKPVPQYLLSSDHSDDSNKTIEVGLTKSEEINGDLVRKEIVDHSEGGSTKPKELIKPSEKISAEQKVVTDYFNTIKEKDVNSPLEVDSNGTEVKDISEERSNLTEVNHSSEECSD